MVRCVNSPNYGCPRPTYYYDDLTWKVREAACWPTSARLGVPATTTKNGAAEWRSVRAALHKRLCSSLTPRRRRWSNEFG